MLNPPLKDLNLPSKELKKLAKLLAKERDIKGYESMSEDNLLSALKASESEKNFDKTRIKKIREELKKLEHKFSKSEIKEIRKKLYEIENKKSLSAPEKIEEYLFGLEENLSKLKKYYDNNKDKYNETSSIRSLLDLPIHEYYFKPIITNSAFNGNYIQYESMGGDSKDKNLSIKKYLDKIKPYLSDMRLKEKNGGFILVIK